MDPHERFNETYVKFVETTATLDLSSEEATTAVKNLKTFSECRPPEPEPEPTPEYVPVTRWEKFKAGASSVLDNETTRTFIKAVGAFGGVAVVTYSTIYKDHVIERQAMAQANQRNS